MGKYFGTDGFRGRAGETLTALHAFRIGSYLGHYFSKQHEHPKIVIGKDTRRSSYMLGNALAAGITAQGCDAYLLHVTTTPSVSYITCTEGFDCGIMISASHNPFDDNGIKLMNGQGEKADDALQDEIEKYIDGEIPELPAVSGDRIGKTIDHYSGRTHYIGFLTSLASASFESRKVVLDCANGASFMIAPAVFNALGADTKVIHQAPSGLNINDHCGSTHIEALQAYIRENGADVGFAFDGDADRCIAVDEHGAEVNGDKIMYILAKYLKSKDLLPGNKVVTTVMSNFGLYKALDSIGIGYEKTAVGDRFVYENMKKNGFAIGGEQSGHIILRQFAHTGDGLITALMLMRVMTETCLPLSILASDVKMYPQVLKNAEVDDKEKTLSDPAVQKAVADASAALGDNGRVLLRQSGTEPVLRVMAEAKTHAECESHVSAILEAMRTAGHLLKVR